MDIGKLFKRNHRSKEEKEEKTIANQNVIDKEQKEGHKSTYVTRLLEEMWRRSTVDDLKLMCIQSVPNSMFTIGISVIIEVTKIFKIEKFFIWLIQIFFEKYSIIFCFQDISKNCDDFLHGHYFANWRAGKLRHC